MRVRERNITDRWLEPISRCLIRHLMVPNIYWGVETNLAYAIADIVAIDRAGSGDVHMVEMKGSSRDAVKAIRQVMTYPANYRWIAVPLSSNRGASSSAKGWPLFPDDGPGRVGVIGIVKMSDGNIGANIVTKAERFADEFPDNLRDEFRRKKPDIHFH